MRGAAIGRRGLAALLGFGLLAGCGGNEGPTAPTTPIQPQPAPSGYTAGQTYFGRNHYVEYLAGEMPIVISAPHGGSLVPAEIPNRTWGETGTDTNTQDTARAVADALRARTGRPVHLVLCNLRRSKLDANREVAEAAQGNPFAIQAWTEYHGFIDAARQAISIRYGRGLYVDLHGHGHPKARLEIGYLLDAGDLGQSDTELDQSSMATQSSIRTLAVEADVPFSELLRGPTSLGGLLEGRGVPSVPSPSNPGPGADPYFNGGYSTARHGSQSGGPISGVQIECHYAGVRDTAANRAAFASALADVLAVYVNQHFRMAL